MTSAPSAIRRSTFSLDCLSVVVNTHLYPRTAATSASPMPVLPEVPSIIVPPGLSRPFFSASSIMVMPMRSFTEPPGLVNSALTYICGFRPWLMRFRRISGVWPTASKMLLHFILMSRAERRVNGASVLCHNSSSLACCPIATQRTDKGDTLEPAKYFERCAVGADCGILARGTNREHHFGFGNDGHGTGWQNRWSGRCAGTDRADD